MQSIGDSQRHNYDQKSIGFSFKSKLHGIYAIEYSTKMWNFYTVIDLTRSSYDKCN
jgi:hypothetical protein